MKKPVLFTAATLAFAALAFANHLPVALSYVSGVEILTHIDLRVTGDSLGVPPYIVSTDELEDTVAIAPGAQFSVVATDGTTETVTFDSADFADMSAIPVEEVAAYVNARLSVATAEVDNAHFTVRGLASGGASTLGLVGGATDALSALNLAEATVAGEPNARLAISIPSEHGHDGEPEHHEHEYAGFQYLLVASATDGVFHLPNGLAIPIGIDAWTIEFFDATAVGLLPGFYGVLDDHGDAEAVLPTTLLPVDTLPSKLYFSYLVLDPAGGAVFTSNRFTIDIVD